MGHFPEQGYDRPPWCTVAPQPSCKFEVTPNMLNFGLQFSKLRAKVLFVLPNSSPIVLESSPMDLHTTPMDLRTSPMDRAHLPLHSMCCITIYWSNPWFGGRNETSLFFSPSPPSVTPLPSFFTATTPYSLSPPTAECPKPRLSSHAPNHPITP